MASSFVKFQGFGFWSTDNTLDDWLNFLGSEINKLQDKPAWLSEYRQNLHEQNYIAGRGFMDPGLDEFLTGEERKAILINLVKKTITRIEGYGGFIATRELLEMGLGVDNPYVGWSVETTTTDRMLNIGNAFLRLLQGEIKMDASTSPVMDSREI